MSSRVSVLAILIASALILAACPAPAAPAEQAAPEPAAVEATAAPEAQPAAAPGSGEEFERILQCVKENFPAEKYMTNELLPDPDAEWTPMDCETVDTIRIGMPWVLNDEEAPWYNAIEKGYFADMCLEVELVPGGPGLDHMQTLAAGSVDIAVAAGGSTIPQLVASRTPADVVAVGTFLKQSPYIWLGIDNSIPKDQRSTLELKPEDFIGKKIGMQGGNDYIFNWLINAYDLPADQITVMEAGFTPDPILVGAMDYVGAWLVNQPRLVEQQGFMNWVAFQFSDWGFDGYSDVSAVRRETLESNPDLVKRYLAAVNQGIKFLLENPEESAEIAVKYGVDAQLTKEQALRRFELQQPLVVGSDDLPIMVMTPEGWNNQIATFVQYNQIELEACK